DPAAGSVLAHVRGAAGLPDRARAVARELEGRAAAPDRRDGLGPRSRDRGEPDRVVRDAPPGRPAESCAGPGEGQTRRGEHRSRRLALAHEDARPRAVRHEARPLGPDFVGMSGRVFVGTSGFSFPDWVGPFYPTGMKSSDFLNFYSRRFDIVEVNATYYRIPPPKTLEQMERKTPD